jgi:hypothetical protein
MDEECPICLNKLETSISLKCGHKYHRKCLLEWKKRASTCPKCRKQIVIVKTNYFYKIPDYISSYTYSPKKITTTYVYNPSEYNTLYTYDITYQRSETLVTSSIVNSHDLSSSSGASIPEVNSGTGDMDMSLETLISDSSDSEI